MHDPLEFLRFPDPRWAPADGLLAVGGDYSPERLLVAYAQGIFPWPSAELPYAWFSPNPRAVLVPSQLHVPRRLLRTLRQARFRVTFDTAFPAVIRGCAASPRQGQAGTWITPPLIAGFVELHRLGFAHSVETWQSDRLVGGLYGTSLGAMFAAESMFYCAPDASKVALVTLVAQLARWGFLLFDCQVLTPHAARFGAQEWPRGRFLRELARALERPTRRGPWSAEFDLPEERWE